MTRTRVAIGTAAMMAVLAPAADSAAKVDQLPLSDLVEESDVIVMAGSNRSRRTWTSTNIS